MRHFEKEPHPGTGIEGLLRDLGVSDETLQEHVAAWNRTDRQKVGLSAEGKRRAEKTAELLPAYLERLGVPLRRIFVSPYRRTLESADALIERFPDIECHVAEELVELDPGARCLGTFEEVCARFPEFDTEAHAGFLDACPPFGESHSRVRDWRVKMFLERLTHFEGATLVMTHAGIIECVHQLAYGTSDTDVVAKFAENRSCRFGSMLVCRYDAANDRFEPIADDLCLSEPSL